MLKKCPSQNPNRGLQAPNCMGFPCSTTHKLTKSQAAHPIAPSLNALMDRTVIMSSKLQASLGFLYVHFYSPRSAYS